MVPPGENARHGRRTGRHLYDDGKDPRLVVVIPVCSNTQVYLAWVGICLTCGADSEEAGDVRCVGGEGQRAIMCTIMTPTHPVGPEGRSSIILEDVVSVG